MDSTGFLKTESRGLAHALAYHPQWTLFEMFWTAVTDEIAAQKAVLADRYQDASDLSPKDIKGSIDGGQYGVLHNLKESTSKKEFIQKGAPAFGVLSAKLSMKEKEAFRKRRWLLNSSLKPQNQCPLKAHLSLKLTPPSQNIARSSIGNTFRTKLTPLRSRRK